MVAERCKLRMTKSYEEILRPMDMFIVLIACRGGFTGVCIQHLTVDFKYMWFIS